MKTYLIIDVKIRNKDKYYEYIKKARPIVESFGGQHLIISEKISSLSETWKPERIVIIEFKDKKSLEKCFSSENYLKIKNLREESADSKAIVVEGNTQ